jgi:DNA-binding transcriptional regulator GbsR (MarR family)
VAAPPRRTVDEDERAFVEDLGIYFEGMGAPRMAGRIVGRLLVADPAEQSSAQLMRYLDASKASISTNTRYLIQLGLIERVGVPGERIDHFRLRRNGFVRFMQTRIRQVGTIRELLDRGLDLQAAERDGVRERIRDVHDFYVFVEREVPALLDRFERDRTTRRGSRSS